MLRAARTSLTQSAEAADEAFRKMTSRGRVGKMEAVADLVLFQVSDRAAFIHGANITIDGGYTQGLMG